MEYRNEIKFDVSEMELQKILYRLVPIMNQDQNQKGTGYVVRSVYFDDIYNTYMLENEDGVDNRKKYRIRIYNADIQTIRLEKKIKYRGMTKKVSQILTKEQADALLIADWNTLREQKMIEKGSLLEEMFVEALRKGLKPRCIVEYERFALVEERGNVRVTFDRNIVGCNELDGFFERKLSGVPVMSQGRHILEVKYDELLPHYILQAIDIGTLRKQSFSKYYAVRAVLG